MILDQDWRRNKEAYPEQQFEVYGPFWQPECHWCGILGDCYDSPTEANEWVKQHNCDVVNRAAR